MATVIDQESSSPAGVATTPGPVANSIAMQDVVPPSHASPPSAHVKLDLLLTSGQRKIWKFPTTHTAYAVKEQVWNEWPSEWDERPTHPSALRLLYMGHFLDETAALPSPQANTTSSNTQATVIHLIIRPGWAPGGDTAGDDDSLKKHRGGNNAVGGCRCVIC